MRSKNSFLRIQIASAESHALGRARRYCTIDKNGRFHEGERRVSAKDEPPLVVQMEGPVGRSRKIQKPE